MKKVSVPIGNWEKERGVVYGLLMATNLIMLFYVLTEYFKLKTFSAALKKYVDSVEARLKSIENGMF